MALTMDQTSILGQEEYAMEATNIKETSTTINYSKAKTACKWGYMANTKHHQFHATPRYNLGVTASLHLATPTKDPQPTRDLNWDSNTHRTQCLGNKVDTNCKGFDSQINPHYSSHAMHHPPQ